MAEPVTVPDETAETTNHTQTRKVKRKAAKKLKRKQLRAQIAVKAIEEEQARLNDPEEQNRIRLKQQEEAEIRERELREFEERERAWLEAAAKRKQEEDDQRVLLEESTRNQEGENEWDEDDGDEYMQEGPAEIIWQGNEIIVKKKRVKVTEKLADHQPKKEDDDRPTSNPLPPQSAVFAAYSQASSVSLQHVFDNVAQQVPNFGTEQDKAHCPFHIKTGACRFGSRCSRVHLHPDKSCTLLIKNMYSGPGLSFEQDEGLEYTDEEIERCYEEFYEDVHTEFLKFGEIVNFKVCCNGSSHLRGNVYVHYKSPESAVLAYSTVNGRYFAGKQIICEFVGVSRWKVAICGEYMKSRYKTCSRGTACNFLHCFRNPGGDYEWADCDNPPPMYWTKKMVALFGTLDESQYDKLVEARKGDANKTASKKHKLDKGRSSSRGSRYCEDNGSSRENSNDYRSQGNHRSKRRSYSTSQARTTFSPDERKKSGKKHDSAHHRSSGRSRFHHDDQGANETELTDISGEHQCSEKYRAPYCNLDKKIFDGDENRYGSSSRWHLSSTRNEAVSPVKVKKEGRERYYEDHSDFSSSEYSDENHNLNYTHLSSETRSTRRHTRMHFHGGDERSSGKYGFCNHEKYGGRDVSEDGNSSDDIRTYRSDHSGRKRRS
ncbi:zinc finger CCCH domain-containing protein 5 isoform X2 [Aristolochia californica]|uniref:zinc finger CCCH domain-containing protein 5 isoform X2 n=1 Tax=Aristolochia californica TaxID=171875 RepID=UPI0035E3311B